VNDIPEFARRFMEHRVEYRMINAQRIRKVIGKKTVVAELKVRSRTLPGGTAENPEEYESGRPVPEQRFQPETSCIQNRSASAWVGKKKVK
jgi:hypothetical protein